MYRMTNREVENVASPFLSYVMNPLKSLSENKHFSELSKGVQSRIYVTVIKQGL